MALKKKKLSIDVPDIGSVVREYDLIRENEKMMKKRKSELATVIKEYADSNGVPDDKGSLLCSNDEYSWGKQIRKSVSLNQEKALEFLKVSGLDNCITFVEIVNEEELENQFNVGNVTQEDLESISEIKVSYSTTVTKKEVIEDVEESDLQLASQDKPRNSLFKKRK